MAKEGYSDQELNSMSTEQLRKLDKELSSKTDITGGRTTPKPIPTEPPLTNHDVPNQVTLPSGDTVNIPTFNTPSTNEPKPPLVSPRDEFYTCCWNETTDQPDDTLGNNLTYPQANLCYSRASFAWPINFLFVDGTIYINGVPSTNPLACTEFNWINYCDRPCSGGQGTGSSCDNDYPPPSGCDNGFCDCIAYFSYWPSGPQYEGSCEFGTSWRCRCEQNDECGDVNQDGQVTLEDKTCKYVPWTYPNYGMNGWNNPTGNADVIAAIWNGTIVGFDFINSIDVSGSAVPGLVLPIQHQHENLSLGCYPISGDTIDNLKGYLDLLESNINIGKTWYLTKI